MVSVAYCSLNLMQKWQQQAEANDEVERLLSAENIQPEQITKR